MIISIISIILLIILSIILLLLYKKEKKKLKKEFIENFYTLFNQELEKNRQRLDDEVEEYKRKALAHCNEWREAQMAERLRVDKSLEERKQAVEEIIERLENRRREAEKQFGWSYNSIKKVCDKKTKCTHNRYFRYSNPLKRELLNK